MMNKKHNKCYMLRAGHSSFIIRFLPDLRDRTGRAIAAMMGATSASRFCCRFSSTEANSVGRNNTCHPPNPGKTRHVCGTGSFINHAPRMVLSFAAQIRRLAKSIGDHAGRH